MAGRGAPLVGCRLHQPGELSMNGPVVLRQAIDPHPAFDEGTDHFSDRVVPLIDTGIREHHVTVGVGRLGVVDLGLGLFEVAVHQRE
jgi:hypothetical protein